MDNLGHVEFVNMQMALNCSLESVLKGEILSFIKQTKME